jgi:hypothetical protein
MLPKKESNCIGEKVGRHVRDKVASERIKRRQDYAAETRDHEMWPPPTSEMRESEGYKGDQRRKPAHSRKLG